MFIIVWEYTVKNESKDRFIDAYKENGVWGRLFGKSPVYRHSRLFQKNDKEFLLIDTWESRQGYQEFKLVHDGEYMRLSAENSFLYESERKLGEYDEIGESTMSEYCR